MTERRCSNTPGGAMKQKFKIECQLAALEAA
jgi:hypothetical protein